jgi:glucan biosynthesis protein C
MSAYERRYDIDRLRVIAIGLLLVYHVAIGFQGWGAMIGFMVNEKTWESLWIPMSMINVWRIPLLFFVAGMGIYFSIQNRNWKQVIIERMRRILLPFVFGVFFIVPLYLCLLQFHYHWEYIYRPDPGHLWFLGNIFIYTLFLLPVFFFLKKKENGKMVSGLKKCMHTPLVLLLVIIVLVSEALLIKPVPYELYAMTWHGFILGMLGFFFGFCFMVAGTDFWRMMLKWRLLFFIAAISLFAWRLVQFQMRVPSFLLSIESVFWIFSAFSFGYRHLNKPDKILSYLSQAAYPVYIIHMLFLFLGSSLIFPLAINVGLKFILVLIITGGGSLVFYECFIKRVNFIRPLFGLKRNIK